MLDIDHVEAKRELMRDSITATALVALLLSLTNIVVAQNTPLAFEVVSLKPMSFAARGQRGQHDVITGGGVSDLQGHRFIARDSTLYAMIKWAYGITSSKCTFSECDFLTGGPAWVRLDQFEIQAVMPEDSPIYTYSDMANGRAPALQAMLQSFLAERFKVKVHSEMREMPVYLLSIAKGGPKMTPANNDDKRRAIRIDGDLTGKILDRTLRGTKASMAMLVNALGLPSVTDRPVLDRTGIAGEFDFEVRFAPVDNNAFVNTSSSSIFTALQEQLGLRLEASKAQVEVFVIDHAEKPGEN